jgi:carbamoyl-phosphate synthase large subunit
MMMATGEVMAIGNNFESALLKALRSLESSQENLCYAPAKAMTLDELLFKVKKSDDERIFYVSELIRRQVSLPRINAETGIDFFFLKKLAGIVKLEEEIKGRMLEYLNPEFIMKLKKKGFSDKGMSSLMLNTSALDIYNYRKENNIEVSYKMVDTCGGEFDAMSPYYYSSYADYDEVEVSSKKKVLVVGSGPIRIGQGVEFDYCSVHGVLALKEEGIEGIIINNNPETVSTDFDISDKLYFEPITEEDVQNIIDKEKPYGVILQFGGQTAVKLAEYLDGRGINILGTSFDSVDLTEDRDRFIERMSELNLPYPKGVGVTSVEEGVKQAEKLGYPLIVRPSYVIGGLGMQVVTGEVDLRKYLKNSITPDQKNPVLIDQYMAGKEIEVDAISDGKDVLIPGIMEHLEEAGVHSGDSISIYPTFSLSEKHKAQLLEHTKKIATGFNLVGLLNIQYVLYKDEIYILEVNPRASRTVPFISKVTDIPMIDLATKVMLGMDLKDLGYGVDLAKEKDYYAVKHPVFSMEKILDTEIALGPEMKSTGEVLSMEKTLNKALFKGFMSTYQNALKGSKVFVSLPDAHKSSFVEPMAKLIESGYRITCTEGTYNYMKGAGITESAMTVCPYDDKVLQKELQDPELAFVVALPKKGHNNSTFGFKIRRLSVEKKLPCLTSFDTAKALADIIGQGIDAKDIDIYDICAV